MRHTTVNSPVGPLTLVAQDAMLTRLIWETQRAQYTNADLGPLVSAPTDPVFRVAVEELTDYFCGTGQQFTVPLQPAGTGVSREELDRDVWQYLQHIPYGTTVTYGEIARELTGQPAYAQRIGQAVGANPIGLIIPCHRVVASDGGMRGFAGGIPVKRWLLEHEGAVPHTPTLF